MVIMRMRTACSHHGKHSIFSVSTLKLCHVGLGSCLVASYPMGRKLVSLVSLSDKQH